MDKFNAIERLGNVGIVPVVVIDDAGKAVPAANALFAGSIDVMEITLRTAAGLDAIKAVAEGCPEMLIGAGTVLSLEKCKQSVEAGAKFIVSPGFNREMVEWCVENDIAVTPGCVTPTEIMAALELGVNIIKFFPANIYGGPAAMKALAGPFGNVKFVPTGGINAQNVGEYGAMPFVHAVGGSWLCAKEDINSENYDKITALSAEAVRDLMGFELAHLGINANDADESQEIMNKLSGAFGFEKKPGESSNFSGAGFEVMKTVYLGKNGHIAIKTGNIQRAIYYLEKKGFKADPDTCKYKGDKMIAIYLKDEFGGFAVHLLQK